MSSSASSAPQAPIAPFDACPGFHKYMSHAWYEDARKKIADQGVTVEFDIAEACLSADYLIAAIRTWDTEENFILRYNIRTRTLERPAQNDGKSRPVATSFGKRNGDLIPLMLDGCRSGTYDIRHNVIMADGARCETNVCTLVVNPDYGWPEAQKYKHLTHLGTIFTAADCGDARLKQVHPSTNYTEGSAIFLKVKASVAFENELRAIGFACRDESCLTWENESTSIPVSDLLRLRPYVGEMKNDDCRHCG